MAVITEAELRELWQNGQGTLPEFAPGTRFTPAARDFLAAMRQLPPVSASGQARGQAGGPPGVFYTEQDINDRAARGETALALSENDRLTALAQDRAAALGLRITRPGGTPPASAAPRSHNPALLTEPPAPRPLKEPAMRKTFLTDVDIEDLARQGVTRLEVTPDTVLTDLAREKARRLGIELVVAAAAPAAPPVAADEALFQAVRAGVLARLPAGVDPAMADAVIRKVIAGL